MAHYKSKYGNEVITDFQYMRLDTEEQKQWVLDEKPMPKLRKDPNFKTGLVTCSECGGSNVQEEAWVNANTHKYIDSMDSDYGYCEDCRDSVELNYN